MTTFSDSTAADWDAAQAESVVHHEQPAATDWSASDVIELGYPTYDTGGTNLEFYLPLDEDSGTTANDVSGNGRDGNIAGATPGQTGIRGTTAYLSDGVDDVIELTYSGISGSTNRTFECWVNTSLNSDQSLVSFGEQTVSGAKWVYRIDEASTAGTWVPRIEVSGGFLRGTTHIADGAWHHIACVLEGTDVTDHTLYVDGVAETVDASSAEAVNTDTTTSEGVHLMRRPSTWGGTGGRTLDGLMDEPRLYSRALSASEIQAHAHGNTPTGSLTSAVHTVADATAPDTLTTTTSLNGGSIDVAVFEDTNQDGTADHSQTVSLAGGVDETNSLSGFSGGTDVDYWVEIRPSVPSPTAVTPTFSSYTVESVDTGGTAISVYGDLVGSGTLDGQVSADHPVSGSLTGAGTVDGSISAQRSVSGSLTGAGTVAGEVAAQRSVSGSPIGSGTIDGRASADHPVSGSLSGSGEVDGQIATQRSVSGSLTGAGTADGRVRTQRSVSGDLLGAGDVEGSAVAQHSVSGDLAGDGDVSGSIQRRIGVEGELTGSGSVDGYVRAEHPVTGSLLGSGTVDGRVTLSSVNQVLVYGDLTASGTVEGTATVDHSVSGSLTGSGTVDASVGVRRSASGTLVGSGTVDGSVAVQQLVSGDLLGTGDVDGVISGAVVEGILHTFSVQGVHDLDRPTVQGVHSLDTPIQGVHDLDRPIHGVHALDIEPMQGVHVIDVDPMQGVHSIDVAPMQGVHDVETAIQGAHSIAEVVKGRIRGVHSSTEQ